MFYLRERFAKLIHHFEIDDIHRRMSKRDSCDRLVMADCDPGSWFHVKILADSAFIPERSEQALSSYPEDHQIIRSPDDPITRSSDPRFSLCLRVSVVRFWFCSLMDEKL